MAQTTVQAEKCSNCGIEARSGAEYCYNCGSKVAAEIDVLVEAQKAVEPDNTSSVFEARPPSADRIPIPEIPIDAVEPTVEKVPTEKKPMRTAASLRRDRNRGPAKPKEVLWVQHEGPGTSFIVSSVIVIVITAIILLAAIYLK